MNRVLGVVAEYNPLHNGHIYHLEQSKKLADCNYSIAVLGGNFTQRGDASIVNKWSKAEMALQAGFDLVLELPTLYATSSAENFADGAIKVLDSLKVVDAISFGSEIGDLDKLDSIAEVLYKEPKEYSTILQRELKEGVSYAKAQENAINTYLKKSCSKILNSPNNILSIEYLKALKRRKSSMVPVTIKREVDNSSAQVKKVLASSTEIRSMIAKKKNVKTLIPKSTFNVLRESIRNGELVLDLNEFEDAILYSLRKMSVEEIAMLPNISEGLENKIKKASNEYNSLENVIEEIKSKRYPETRVKRILIHSLLGITQKDIDMSKRVIPYIRVLGFTARGQKMISAISKKNPKLNIIVSVKHFMEQSSNKNLIKMLSTDILATNIYTLAYSSNGIANLDYTRKPVKF